MPDRVYRSRVDAWLWIALCLPVAGSLLALVLGVANGQPTSLYIGAAALAFYGLVIAGLVYPMTYTIDDVGLRIVSGRMRLRIPWANLLEVRKSSNPLSSPALSLRRLNIEYVKQNGKQTFVLISPTDRDAFLRDAAAASPRHRLDGDALVPR